MAISTTKYQKWLLGIFNGTANETIDFDTDTTKVSLHTVTYVPSATADDFWNDTTNEVTGTNYTTKGQAIGSPTVVNSSGTVTFDGNDLTWSASGSGFSNAQIGVFFKDTGTSSTSPVVFWIDFGASVGNTVADLVVVWSGSGIITWA